MRTGHRKLSRTQLSSAALLALLSGTQVHAADVTWNNAAGSFAWNATHPNWSTGAWNSAAGNGAVFGSAGAGAITVGNPVSVDSLSFLADGYALSGPGAITFVAGQSSASTGRIWVDPGVTTSIGTAINSSVGLVKMGGGTLQLSGPLDVTGGGRALSFAQYGYTPRLTNDVIVGGVSQISQGGTLQIMNSSVLPASTRVGIGNGVLDIGANDVTIGELNFSNQADQGVWDPSVNVAMAGVIGTGTLRVNGDINVMGVDKGNDGTNTIATNLDLGGKTQVIRTAGNGTFIVNRALQITGSISNGSLLKTFGYIDTGVMGVPDGLGLYGNNTYTGSTRLNGGTTVVTGTNASSLLEIVGSAGPLGSTVTLQGANGSFLSASKIQAFAGGQFIIDNNGTMGNDGSDMPPIPAAQNNNRVADNAEIQLRNGTFSYLGGRNAAASETFGRLNVVADHGVVKITPVGTGTVTLTAGELALGPRATLQVASASLGGASRFYVTGAMPAADATGILPRIVGSSGFLTYDATTGLTPLAASAYATSFAAGAGRNVAVTAAATVAGSVDVNAIKSTGSFTTTIAAGQTLGVASGMVLNTSGTSTFNGGTLAFGATPGVFLGGTTNVASAVTGSDGLINASSALTLSGDLSGLRGRISNTGQGTTTTIATNTFGGILEARAGNLVIATSQTLAGQGAILLGAPENDADLVGTPVFLRIAAAGKDAVIGRDIIVDNGTQTAAGQEMRFGYISSLAPLSNTTGSQTLSGNVTINSAFRLQGGAADAGSTGATNFTGNISGSAPFIILAGRASFSGNVGNAGGFRIGEGGFRTDVSFTGTTSGSVPITMIGGSGPTTTVRYAPGALPTGTITFADGYAGANASILIPLASSTIDNTIDTRNADIGAQVGAGITARWNGTLNGDGGLVKTGAGTLVLGNAANTLSGGVALQEGALYVLGNLPSQAAVYAGATLGGTGNLGGPLAVLAGGTLAPGMDGGTGTLAVGSVGLAGTLLADIDLSGAADLLKVDGTFGIAGGSLAYALADAGAGGFHGGTYLLVANDGGDAIDGTFAGFGSASGLPAGWTASIDYAFRGTDALGRIGDGNDLALTISAVPEPSSYAMFGAGLLLVTWLRRRRHD